MSICETEHPTIETLFRSLDKWRHFASYPLEARVDALVGLFLPRVIEDCYNVKMCSQIIPQFPLKKPNNNRSDKVDFFVLSNDAGRAFLVELKTDMGSMNKKQCKYLKRASNKEMRSILSDIKVMAQASKSRGKYYHLINALSDLKLLRLPCQPKEMKCKEKTTVSAKYIKGIKVTVATDLKPVIVYVQPRKDASIDTQNDFKYIDFEGFAKSIESCGDLGSLLACYLRRWKTDPGSVPPAKA